MLRTTSVPVNAMSKDGDFNADEALETSLDNAVDVMMIMSSKEI